MAPVDPGPPAALRVEVVYCPGPGQVQRQALSLPAGATLDDALKASGLDTTGLRAGIWGKARAPDTVLRERDRIELYRELTVDPKEARRQRYRRDRAVPRRQPGVGPKP